MSGTPKYSQAQLAAQRKREQEQQRQRQAAEEARLRAEAEARRQRELEQQRRQAAAEEARLRAEVEARHAAAMLDAEQRRIKAERQHREARAKLGWELDELARQLAESDPQEGAKLDDAGRRRVESELASSRAELGRDRLEPAKEALERGKAALVQHRADVVRLRLRWEAARDAARQALDALDGAVSGLAADPVVMLWETAQVAALRQVVDNARADVGSERFAEATSACQAAAPGVAELVARASASQLKADERDAIVAAMRGALHELGFAPGEAVAEHPGKPDSAVVFAARSAGGKMIGVSVPTDGKVWYEVDGFEMLGAAHSGGHGATCDKAETTLDEMRRVLGERFGVEVGEIEWKGKDPDRVLRRADQLPGSAPAAKRGMGA